jgi:hypothetical protein
MPLEFVPCQYHVTPDGGVPDRVIVTEVHCGELLVGAEGVFGFEDTVTVILPLVVLQHPEEFWALI